MVLKAVEDSRHLSLRFTVPDEASVASPAQGQRKGIKEDGLTGTRLTCEDAQALAEVKLKLVDKNDIADRQLDQHGG
jgi:hypothetical protein